jgi:dihydroxyacetone kinase
MSDEQTQTETLGERPKKFLNQVENSVDEFIEGLLLTYPNKLQQLENQHVVLAKPIKEEQKVHILSGGGSGHEPSHAGWIGDGMLTGAILGGIFASPPVSSILAAIRAVTPVIEEKENIDGRGCLLIVKNYTGDRLNFGMACEMANAEKRPCQIVIVADDCAIPRSKGETGARGVAGTILVHKAAGAAAAKGLSLDEVVQVAEQTATRIGSLGVALEAVTLPGAATVNNRLAGNKMEIGLGIHGEAGIRQTPLMSSQEIAKEMVDTIFEFGYKPIDSNAIIKLQKGDNVILLVNNLGGTSNFELSILARDLVRYLEGTIQCRVSRVIVGSFMTSFNMHGASASILCLKKGASDSLSALIDAPTNAPGKFRIASRWYAILHAV